MSTARLAALALLVAGCSKGSDAPAPPPPPAPTAAAPTPAAAAAPPPSAAPKGSWYRGEFAFDGIAQVPFFMQLPDRDGEGSLESGAAATPIDVVWDGDEVIVKPRWNWPTEMVATKGADGTLSGTWVRDIPMWGRVERAMTAAPVDAPRPIDRFLGGEPPKGDVTGVWRFDFKVHKLGKGELVQHADGTVSGFIRPGSLGDSRLLLGELQGDRLLLSGWNGNSATYWTATLSADGKRLTDGMSSALNVWNEPFTAERVEDWDYVNKLHLAKGKTTLSKVPALAKYKGKPVVLVLFATWCPTCNDMTPYIVKLHEKYAPRGVEFLSLAYDLSEDKPALEAELETFRAKYGVTWETVAMATTPQKWEKAMPPEIKDWNGFPITVFVKPDGTVHAIYGGWFGKATGDNNRKLEAQFDAWAADLVPPV